MLIRTLPRGQEEGTEVAAAAEVEAVEVARHSPEPRVITCARN
jgi:hypothetical protein